VNTLDLNEAASFLNPYLTPSPKFSQKQAESFM